jgi:adenosylcobinamide kinase/adenosylcobinamide-phosphate guanylyltransferase
VRVKEIDKMARRLTLVLGGARSGKSSYAEQLAAEQDGDVIYVATAEAWDDEMRRRIEAHKTQRPAHWQTVEAPRHPGPALATVLAGRAAAPDTAVAGSSVPPVVLVDCLTLLANNVLITLPEHAGEMEATNALLAEVDELLAVWQAGAAHWIVVSNEVGLGIVPAYPLGRLYRDALGRANQRVAALADAVVFMVAGIPMYVKG